MNTTIWRLEFCAQEGACPLLGILNSSLTASALFPTTISLPHWRFISNGLAIITQYCWKAEGTLSEPVLDAWTHV